MAGSATVFTETIHDTVKEIKCEWTSDSATGGVSGTTLEYYTGKILGLATVPGTAGAQPDDNYNLTAIDRNSLDVLMSGGLLRDETNTEYVLSTSLGAVVASQLTITIDTAGNSKTGVVYIYIR